MMSIISTEPVNICIIRVKKKSSSNLIFSNDFAFSSVKPPSAFVCIRPRMLIFVISILKGELLLFILYLRFCYSLIFFRKSDQMEQQPENTLLKIVKKKRKKEKTMTTTTSWSSFIMSGICLRVLIDECSKSQLSLHMRISWLLSACRVYKIWFCCINAVTSVPNRRTISCHFNWF